MRDRRQKRSPDKPLVTIGAPGQETATSALEILALDEALHKLDDLNQRRSRVVEMAFFAGLTQSEIAESLGVSIPTVRCEWRVARAWLSHQMQAS